MAISNVKYKLEEYLQKEYSIRGLEDIEVYNDIPLWRIIRTRFRKTLMESPSKTTQPEKGKVLYYTIKSLWQIIKLKFSGKHYENVVFPHARLFNVNGIFIERLSDPFIDYSTIKDDYIIFERCQNGKHHTPRFHAEKIIYWDIVTTTSFIASIFFRKQLTKRYDTEIDELIQCIKQEFDVNNSIKAFIQSQFADYIVSEYLSRKILNIVSPKRVFLAARTTYQYVMPYCKTHGITTYEWQHGITHGETSLYSGKYNKNFDPDYFLCFGKDNLRPVFGMPIERMINVGFAYKEYINNLTVKEHLEKHVLVISEPMISQTVVDFVAKTAGQYPSITFDIRCHPQEKLSKDMFEQLEKCSNVKVVENKTESFVALNKYDRILGENSSVMYEALFLGKKVGRLNYDGLKVVNSGMIGGDIINNAEELRLFFESNEPSPNLLELYSDFNVDVVNNLK